MVLLKGLDDRGFVFFTNYESRKGEEIDANPRVSLLFPWHDLQRQVRVEGTGRARLPGGERGLLRRAGPASSQLGAWASPQSRVVASRAALDERYGGVLAQFADVDDVPLPPHWGGFRVVPEVRGVLAGPQGPDARPAALPPHARRPARPWTVERLAP